MLKVVPPQSTQPAPLKTEPERPELPLPEPASPSVLPKLAIFGLIVLGISAISFIQVPNSVSGEATITSTIDAREHLTMPVPGRIQIYVKTNQNVKLGELIASIQSDELDNRLLEAERELERAKVAEKLAQQRLLLAQSQLDNAIANEMAIRDRAQRQERELKDRDTLPQIRRLEREREVIPQQIEEIEAEIAGIEAEISGLRANLAAAMETTKAYESLQIDGAIRRQELWEARSRQASIQAQIQQRESAIRSKRDRIQQQYSLIAAKSEEMNEAGKMLRDRLYEREDDVTQTLGQTQIARQELQVALAEARSQQQLTAKWETNWKQLQQQRERLRIFARVPGTIITPDLDIKNNARLEAGAEILSIVDLARLTAEVKIRQEDKDLIEPHSGVKFYRQGDTTRYTAVVEDSNIAPVMQTEKEKQKPMLGVKIVIDNQDRLLLPGMDGYAHIETRQLYLHEKVMHEFNKLFNFGKYWS